MIIKKTLFGMAAGFLLIHKVYAAMPSGDPVIRVDTTYHSGPIYGVEPLPDNERLVTISHDKTVKIWRSRDFKLLKTLRIPIGDAYEGNLDSIAVSPDGKFIAVGGWTCWQWDQQGCVYLFDAATGELKHCIDRLKNIIGALRFSPDGKVLAIGLHGNGGVAFVDTQSFQVLAQDQEYGERVTGLAFSNNGYVVSASNDGYLRVYDPQFKLAARVKVPEINRIADSYFSPDGKRLLVSSYDSPLIQILSLPQLQVEHSLRTAPGQSSLKTLRGAAWSQSGEFIYGVGDSDSVHETEILRWRITDLSRYETIKVAHRIQSIRPHGQNGVIFSTEDASIGVINDQDSAARISDTHLVQSPIMSGEFRVSADGKQVTIPVSITDNQNFTFDIERLSLSESGSMPGHKPKNKPQKRIQLTHWKDNTTPVLNGQPLRLEPFEEIRSFSGTGNQTFLGTDWLLRAYDKNSQLSWKTPTPGAVWNVTVSEDDKWVVAVLSDGSVRWYRTEDGLETLALFVDRLSREWVLWRPDGYYSSSENGDSLIGWHVNRGKGNEPDFYRAVQFEKQFYRPDLLRAQIGAMHMAANSNADSNPQPNQASAGTRQAVTLSGIMTPSLAEPAPGTFTLSQLNEIAPPRIQIASARAVQTPEGATELELTVEAEKNSRPMQDVTVYANLLPVATNEERRLDVNETDTFRRTFRFPVSGGDSLIRVEVNNGVSLGLAEQWVEVPAVNQTAPPKGDLYVLAVGVNRFDHISAADKNKVPDLKYAVNDAEKLAGQLGNSASNDGFNQVHVQLLTDSAQLPPTRQNILEALKVFEQAGPNDTVLLFLASHGFSDQTGNYYFLPQDGEYNDVESVLSGKNLSGKASTLLSWTDFFDNMRKAAGRRILIVDTCQAKSIFGEFDSRSLRKRSAASLFPLLLASKGDELSQEYEPAQHGLFTHTLLEGLRGLADYNHDRRITLAELHDFSVPLVKKLHNPSAGAQTPQLIAPGSLANIELPLAQSN